MRTYITSNQAAWLLFIFLTSSSVFNMPAPLISYAGNSAWMSILLASTVGLLLLALMLWLLKRHPGKSLIACSQQTIGFTATLGLGLAFFYYQLHMASTIVIDTAMFIRSSMMRNTPSYWFIFLLFTVSAITVRAGIDKFAGMFPVLMVSVVSFIVIVALMSTTNIEMTNLLPIMPDGIAPMLRGAYFTTGVPYLELVLFAMVLPFIGNADVKLGRKLTIAVLCNVGALLAATIVTLLVFGPIAGDRKYSMFEVARTVEVSDVFQRIEALMGYGVVAAAFMKVTLVLFTAHRTAADLLLRPSDKMLVYPIAALMAIVSYSTLRNGEASWLALISVIHPVWGLLCAAVPLFIICAATVLRRSKEASPADDDQQEG